MSIFNLLSNEKTLFLGKSKKRFNKKDIKLGKIIMNYPSDFLFQNPTLLSLARSIVGQQISVKAAQAVGKDMKIR